MAGGRDALDFLLDVTPQSGGMTMLVTFGNERATLAGTLVDQLNQPAADYTIVLFRHEGWKEPVEFMYHCSTKWATFLLSLKKLVETGAGDPAPNDVKVSNWH